MRNDSHRNGDGYGAAAVPRSGKGNNGIIPNTYKALSSYLRIVSSGASTVASTVRSAASAASAIVERDGETNHDQVSWAGFDKLELERGLTRQILLLGYSYGFQVWDVEVAENVHNLVSRHDGPVSFMKILPKPLTTTNQSSDKFTNSHPLLVICADGSFSGGNNNIQEGSLIPSNMSNGPINDNCVPTVVWFYSLRSQSYVHLLRFRSVVHLVRCSSRVVAVLQSNQIHCFNTATLEREYTILTNPVVTGNIGFGPLAVGPRWMAYSGSQVAVSRSGRVSPQHLIPSSSFPGPGTNGSLVAHYAKESSKQLAAGFVTLGDMGYKKLSRYYSELLPEGNNNGQTGNARVKIQGNGNGYMPEADNVGMVIVRDIVSKSVIAQFRAHKSPILSLCFDPSGTLLVTASVQGHNINVFRIMPKMSEDPNGPSYVHLYRLQRGFTNAVIQDISFSCDSQLIMISSSRGTSHLFTVSPSGDSFVSADARCTAPKMLTQQSVCASGPPVTLSAVSRIRNGNNGWRNTVTGAAAAATGRNSPFSGTIASAFHNCKGNNAYKEADSSKKNYHLLVFSPAGCVVQYALHLSPCFTGGATELGVENDARLAVEAIQKWNICHKQNRKEREDNVDLYSSKVYPMKQENGVVLGAISERKISREERHHMYIAEAELQMHQSSNPLWARSEIYFQSMLSDGYDLDEGVCGGEIEIEKIPVRMLEARSKDLVPVFDYLQPPIFRHVKNSDNNEQLQYHVPEDSFGSSISNGGTGVNDLDNGSDETKQKGLHLSSTDTRGGSVNTNDTPIVSTKLETVNTRKDSERA